MLVSQKDERQMHAIFLKIYSLYDIHLELHCLVDLLMNMQHMYQFYFFYSVLVIV